MRPLRITIDLLTPMVESAEPVHLDSLLAWAAVQEAHVSGTFKDYDSVLSTLPLAREERPEGWVWKASFLWPAANLGTRQRYLTRRFFREGFAEAYANNGLLFGGARNPRVSTGYAGKDANGKWQGFDVETLKQDETSGIRNGADFGDIDTTRNHQKNASFLYPVNMVPYLQAFCVGEEARIRQLLETHVDCVGKRARLQHGRVKSINVIEDPQAETLWKQRALPWPEEGYVPVASPVRPPYWKGENRVLAYRPVEFTEFAI